MNKNSEKMVKFVHVVSGREFSVKESDRQALSAYRANSDVLVEVSSGMSQQALSQEISSRKEEWEEREYIRRVKYRRRFGPPGEMPDSMKAKAAKAAKAGSEPVKGGAPDETADESSAKETDRGS